MTNEHLTHIIEILERNINVLRCGVLEAQKDSEIAHGNRTESNVQKALAYSTYSDMRVAFALATGTVVGGAQFEHYLKNGFRARDQFRDLTKMIEAGDKMAGMLSLAENEPVENWPTTDEIDAATAAWHAAKGGVRGE